MACWRTWVSSWKKNPPKVTQERNIPCALGRTGCCQVGNTLGKFHFGLILDIVKCPSSWGILSPLINLFWKREIENFSDSDQIILDYFKPFLTLPPWTLIVKADKRYFTATFPGFAVTTARWHSSLRFLVSSWMKQCSYIKDHFVSLVFRENPRP